MIGKRIESVLWLVIVTLFVFWAAGCTAPLTPQTKQTIADMKNQAAINAEHTKETTAATKAAAQASPLTHPIESANLIVQEVHGPLLALAWICGAAALAGVGLIVASYFVSTLGVLFATIGKLVVPIAGCISLGSWAALFLLGWALWILLAGILLAGGLLIYQLARAHWSIANLLDLHTVNAGKITAIAAKVAPEVLKPITVDNPTIYSPTPGV